MFLASLSLAMLLIYVYYHVSTQMSCLIIEGTKSICCFVLFVMVLTFDCMCLIRWFIVLVHPLLLCCFCFCCCFWFTTTTILWISCWSFFVVLVMFCSGLLSHVSYLITIMYNVPAFGVCFDLNFLVWHYISAFSFTFDLSKRAG